MLLRSHTTSLRTRISSGSSAPAPVPRISVLASAQTTDKPTTKIVEKVGLGDGLGPIGLSYSAGTQKPKRAEPQQGSNVFGLDLGPIGMTYGVNMEGAPVVDENDKSAPAPSIHSMTTAEWRAKYENPDGTIDLWVEEEFNAGSRLVGGRVVHRGGLAGFRTGEGVSAGDVATHHVKIFDHYANQVVEVQVPEDRYVLFDAEDKGLELPYACRMGCCTACAVRVKEGEIWQPEALGISEELKQQGYALMCVGFPKTDLVLETVSEDEIYDLQFGQYFAQQALDPTNASHIERDDFAISAANMDE